jgi:hypothetical protein
MDVEVKSIDLSTNRVSSSLKQGMKSGFIVAVIHFIIMMGLALMSTGRPFKRRDSYGREELDVKQFALIVGGSTGLIFVVSSYLSCQSG